MRGQVQMFVQLNSIKVINHDTKKLMGLLWDVFRGSQSLWTMSKNMWRQVFNTLSSLNPSGVRADGSFSTDAFLCTDRCRAVFITGPERMINLSPVTAKPQTQTVRFCHFNQLLGRARRMRHPSGDRPLQRNDGVCVSPDSQGDANVPLPAWSSFNSPWFILLSEREAELHMDARRKWALVWPQRSESSRTNILKEVCEHRPAPDTHTLIHTVSWVPLVKYSFSYTHTHTHTLS